MPEAIALEFTDPGGDPLRIEWRADALAGLDPAAPDQGPVWALAGELNWDEVEALRIVSGRLDDERLIAIAALRPAGAGGHGDDLVAGAIGEIGAFEQLAEALLSTEYGADGLPSRVGLELYHDEGGLPLRIAGQATATASSDATGVRRLSTALALKAPGTAGAGVLDVLRAS